MPGARQQPVAPAAALAAAALAAAALALAAAPGTARAFHNGSTFDRAPGAGGGGGLFYTGSPRERGWDCTACHVEPRGRLRVDVTSQPPELLAEGRYRAGAAYAIQVAMVDPQGQLGLASTRANYNGMAVTILDAAGAPAGLVGGFDSSRFYARGAAILATDSPISNETMWTFSWTAPAAGAPGPITIHLGVVDGNGAGVGGASTLTDPLGDDVAVLAFTARDEAAAAAAAAAPDPAPPAAAGVAAPPAVPIDRRPGAWAAALALALALAGRPRARRGRIWYQRTAPTH